MGGAQTLPPRFLATLGMTAGLESQLIIAADILTERTTEIARMLNGLLRYLSKPVTRSLRPVP